MIRPYVSARPASRAVAWWLLTPNVVATTFGFGLLSATTFVATTLLTTAFVFTLLPARAQTMVQAKPGQINFSGLDVPSTGSLFGIKGEAGRLVGDAYLDTAWQAGNVQFYGKIGQLDSLAGVPLRLDLLNQELDIRVKTGDVRAVKAPVVRQFALNNRAGGISRFVNVREVAGAPAGVTGFLERLAVGKLTLLGHYAVQLQRANYNAALNAGTRDDELVKQVTYYVARGNVVEKFSPNRKNLLDLMADQRARIDAYLKTERPDLKTAEGLTRVFTYYNGL